MNQNHEKPKNSLFDTEMKALDSVDNAPQEVLSSL